MTQTRPQMVEPDLWLLFAPVKLTPVDLMARMATELGVSALWPVITRNTVARRVNLDRLRANAMEAPEQWSRLSLPEFSSRRRSTACSTNSPATDDCCCAMKPAAVRLWPGP